MLLHQHLPILLLHRHSASQEYWHPNHGYHRSSLLTSVHHSPASADCGQSSFLEKSSQRYGPQPLQASLDLPAISRLDLRFRIYRFLRLPPVQRRVHDSPPLLFPTDQLCFARAKREIDTAHFYGSQTRPRYDPDLADQPQSTWIDLIDVARVPHGSLLLPPDYRDFS